MMKLHQLQALVAVVAYGSIRAAARELHLTQAALTKSLRLLEEDSGVALLIRKSRGVVLTEAGLRLHARAQLVMRQMALAQDELQQAQGDNAGIVRVALTPYLMLTVLGEAFQWFRKRYPRIELRLSEGLVTRVLLGLRDGTVDFAVVADSGDVTTQEFHSSRLQKEQQHLVVRSGHPVLLQPTAARLAALEWVLPGPLTQGLDDGLRAMFEQAGVAPPTLITRCDAMAAMALVRQSDAISVMPAPLLAQPEGHGLVQLSLRNLRPPAIELVLLSPPDVPLTPAAAYLARCLTDAIAAGSNPKVAPLQTPAA
jgi:LysR family transcriptional regulator of abg operon